MKKISNLIYILIFLFALGISYFVYWKLSIYYAIYTFIICLLFVFLGGLVAIFDLREEKKL
jgi:hypothetical protein